MIWYFRSFKNSEGPIKFSFPDKNCGFLNATEKQVGFKPPFSFFSYLKSKKSKTSIQWNNTPSALFKIWMMIMYYRKFDIWKLHFENVSGIIYENILSFLKCQVFCEHQKYPNIKILIRLKK